MIDIDGISGLKELIGLQIGSSEWHEITQEQINQFANVTKDFNWVHVNIERAQRSALGKTIAHGLLTLGLEPMLSNQIYNITNIEYSLDYGYDKIRFPSPVPAGSKIRLHALLKTLDKVPGGYRCKIRNIIELEGSEKPACTTELILHIVA